MAGPQLARDKHNNPIQCLELGTVQTVSVSGTSAATSNAFGTNTTVIRVVCTSDCHIVIAGTPTATTSHSLLPANVVEYFRINGEETLKLAAIQVSEAGTLTVTEML